MEEKKKMKNDSRIELWSSPMSKEQDRGGASTGTIDREGELSTRRGAGRKLGS